VRLVDGPKNKNTMEELALQLEQERRARMLLQEELYRAKEALGRVVSDLFAWQIYAYCTAAN
jgi:hypothetical protein